MESKKYFIIFNALVLSVFSAVQASPLISVGNYANIFFNGSFSTIWQSNVLYEEDNEEDDLLFVITPGLEVDFGSGLSHFDLSLLMNYDIQRYNELIDFDNEYFSISAISSYKAARWSLDGSASFKEKQSTAGQENLINGSANDSGLLILIDDTSADINWRYQVSPKFSFEPGVNYFDREYTNNDQLTDRESFTLPFDIFYKLTPKLDLSFGYQFVTSDIGESILTYTSGTGDVTTKTSDFNQESHFLNVGARGKLLPKLSGFFKIGYRTVDPEDSIRIDITDPLNPGSPTTVQRNSQSTLGLDADFTYLVTPKLTSKLGLSHGFDVGSEGQTVENTSVDLSADYVISGNYTASSFFRYSTRDFADGNSTGEDNIYNLGFFLSYIPDQYLRFNGGYTYIENDSEREAQGYANHSLSFSVSFRY